MVASEPRGDLGYEWSRQRGGKCKGPEAGLCLAQLRTASTGWVENLGDEVPILRDLVATLRTSPLTLGEVGARAGEQRGDRAQFPFNWTWQGESRPSERQDEKQGPRWRGNDSGPGRAARHLDRASTGKVRASGQPPVTGWWDGQSNFFSLNGGSS